MTVTTWTPPLHGSTNWDGPLNAKIAEIIAAVNSVQLFIQPTQPTISTPYLWVKTNIGGVATNYALLFEDGIN